MGVNEVVRGCDLLGSTARQMYLQDLLGYAHPSYAHVPLLVAPDGRRLSKRDRDCDMGVLRELWNAWGAAGTARVRGGLGAQSRAAHGR